MMYNVVYEGRVNTCLYVVSEDIDYCLSIHIDFTIKGDYIDVDAMVDRYKKNTFY